MLGAEGQGCYVLFVCRVLSDVPIPRGQQAQCCLLRWASRAASRGSPFPSVPMGLLGSRSCPFVLGAGERTSSLYSFKEWEGEGRKREPVSEWPPALPAPGL